MTMAKRSVTAEARATYWRTALLKRRQMIGKPSLLTHGAICGAHRNICPSKQFPRIDWHST